MDEKPSSLAFFESQPATDWDITFAHAEVCFAAAVKGDETLHRRHYAKAKQLGAAIAGEEDRKVFLDELERMPKPRGD